MSANSIEYNIGFNAAMIASRLQAMTAEMAYAVAMAAIEMTKIETDEDEGLVWEDGKYDDVVDAIGKEINQRSSGMALTAFVRQETLRHMVEPTLSSDGSPDESICSNSNV